MLRISKIKFITALVVCVFSVYLAIPTLFPKIKAKYIPDTPVNLGLDLKGGVSLLLEVDDKGYIAEQIHRINTQIQKQLKKNKLETDGVKILHNAITINFKDGYYAEKKDDINKSIIDGVKDVLSKEYYKIQNPSPDSLTITLLESFNNKLKNQLVNQSIGIIQRRVDESGTKEIDIQRQGYNQILLQVPGASDTAEIKKLLGKTAKLTFHLVQGHLNYEDVKAGNVPFGVKVIPFSQASDSEANGLDKGNVPLLAVQIHPILSGDMLVDAQPSTNMGAYVVHFKLNNLGARIFAEITANNVGNAIAIVMDGKVISAPVINDVIPTGSGIISSANFSMQSASEFALLLRSGALPTQLNIVEERTVGPSLGEASIKDGTKAVMIGCIAVMVVMAMYYGIWGVFANIALILNLFMIISVLGIMQATLTMPGLAGIALTLGMAVDANVLILERMREEYRYVKNISRTVINAYKLALSTIVDSNLTTIIAAVILYFMGTGPVKGFAVTLIVGILCSMYTSITLTKMMATVWINKFKPTKLSL